jgi:hypothetical protein
VKPVILLLFLIVGDSEKGRFPDIRPYDLLFIDDDHSYQGCSADIANWAASPGTGTCCSTIAISSASKNAIADFMGGIRSRK